MAAEPVDVGNATTADVWPSAATLNLFATNVDRAPPDKTAWRPLRRLGIGRAPRAAACVSVGMSERPGRSAGGLTAEV
jgi:hypothetical protein